MPLEELALQIHLLRLGKAGSFLARVLQVEGGPKAGRGGDSMVQQKGPR